MRAEIISVGTELLLGQITDTNASYLAARLPALGVRLYHISQVGDNLDRLVALLRQARDRSDFVIMTGGLGPTQDDLTREAIAAVMGEQMVIQPDLERDLRAFFARRNVVMPESNVKQATLIASASALANPVGTAPGWWVERDGKIIVAMPGVPSEMYRMWAEQVVPRLRERVRGEVILTRILKVLGMGESLVEQNLLPLLASENPTIATYAKADGIHVRITALADGEDAAVALLEPMERQVREILAGYIYAQDNETLGSYVAGLLASQSATVASAEALSGGTLAQELAGVVAGRGLFRGGLVLPSSDEYAGEAPAIALATRARREFGASIGLGLSGQVSADNRVTAFFVGVDWNGITRGATVSASTPIRDAGTRGVLQVMLLMRDVLTTNQ